MRAVDDWYHSSVTDSASLDYNVEVTTRGPLITVAILMVAAGASFALALDTTNDTPTRRPTSVVTVPTFRGMMLAQAKRLALHQGGRVFVALRAPTKAVAGTVISQTPSLEWPIGLVVSSGPWRDDLAVLPGEGAAPVKPECAVAVTLSSDGNVFPLLCSNSRVNVGAWLFYARNRPSMMSLPRSASRARIIASLCNYRTGTPAGYNLTEETLPEQEDVFILADAYNGWHVPRDLNCAQYATGT